MIHGFHRELSSSVKDKTGLPYNGDRQWSVVGALTFLTTDVSFVFCQASSFSALSSDTQITKLSPLVSMNGRSR